MFQKLLRDLRLPREVHTLGEDFHSQTLGHYYFVFKEHRVALGKDQELISRFDEDGIPINKTYIDVQDKEYVYFPISIGQMGLAVFHTFLETGTEKDKARFLKFADWFMTHADISDDLGARWMTEVSLPAYKNPGPWQSAFAQSRGLSILLRAYQVTGRTDYADMAEKALKAFYAASDKGGVTSFTSYGPFYEEYTASVPTLVLNGMIFSLFGLYDFVRVFPDNIEAQKLFKDGIEAVIKALPDYDLGYWTRYNLCKADWYPAIDPSTIGYQRLHAIQMDALFKMTGNDIFQTYAKRFRSQDNAFNAIRSYLAKYKALKQIGRL